MSTNNSYVNPLDRLSDIYQYCRPADQTLKSIDIYINETSDPLKFEAGT